MRRKKDPRSSAPKVDDISRSLGHNRGMDATQDFQANPNPTPTPQRYRTKASHPCTNGCDNGFFDAGDNAVRKCLNCNGSAIEPEKTPKVIRPRRNPLEHLTPEERARILPYKD